MHAVGHVERMQTLLAEPYGEPFDGRFMAERRIWIRRGVLRLSRILPKPAMDLEEFFGLGVERLKIVIAERPHRRYAVVMAHFFEVAAAEARQARAVHLGVPAHPVVDPGLERPSRLGVKPRLRGDVALFDEDMVGLAVLGLSGQEMATFDDPNGQAAV